MSKSASLPKLPPERLFEDFDTPAGAGTPAWKQEVNQRLAANRARRGGAQNSADASSKEAPRNASDRAAQAAARVAERYAKAPSYSELLAGEARAVVRAAGAAAEAARNAQAAAQAVLFGLESAPVESGLWEPAPQAQVTPQIAQQVPAPAPQASRWLDEPPPAAGSLPGVPSAQARAEAHSYAGAQPRWEEALPAQARDVWSEMRVHAASEVAREQGHSYGGGASVLEQREQMGDEAYDSFDPIGSATIEPVEHIAANLIEFPREIVAARKARPRLAEGPFYDPSQESPQLSIFEVDPELLAPPIHFNEGAIAPPEWASIELEQAQERYSPSETQTYASAFQRATQAYAAPVYPEIAYADEADELDEAGEAAGRAHAYAASVVDESYFVHNAFPTRARFSAVEEQEAAAPLMQATAAAQPQIAPRVNLSSVVEPKAELMVAPLSDRMLAGVVDGALVMLAFLAAAVLVIAATNHPPAGRIALIASGVGLAIFGALYQYLFLSYAEEGTPGMRYARIALCTFGDDNPTREQMRMRIPAQMLSVVPLGIGLLWAAIDGDRLGWHDRLTRTYQRKY